MRLIEKMCHFCKPQEGFCIIHGKIIIVIKGVWLAMIWVAGSAVSC